MRIKPLLLTLLALFPIVLNAQKIENGVLVDASGAPENYQIPEGVKEIAPRVFMMSSIKSVTIPASMEVIHECAFNMAPSLESVTFAPNSKLRIIADQAFEDCPMLKEIKLPNSLDSLGRSAFALCENLKIVTLPANLKKISMGAFSTCPSLLRIDFPAGIEEIGEFAFANCKSISSITLNGVKVVGTKAFYNCKVLSNVTLGEGLVELKDSVFERCEAIEELTIPASMQKSGTKLFFRCPYFKGFKVAANSPYMMAENGVLYSKNKDILYECPQQYSTDMFVVPSETKKIYPMAFYECKNVKGIKLPATIEKLGMGALANNGIAKFDFAGNASFPVYEGCIYYKTKDGLVFMAAPTMSESTKFTLLDETKFIANCAFAFNQNVADVYIPESCLGLGDMAFYSCKGLKNIYSYAVNAPRLGEGTFSEVVLPNVKLHVKKEAYTSYTNNNWIFPFGSDITEPYPSTPNGITGVATNGKDIKVTRLGNNVSISANGNIELVEAYAPNGAKVSEKKLNSNETIITLPTQGIYVVKVKLENGNKKVVKL